MNSIEYKHTLPAQSRLIKTTQKNIL